MKRITFIAWLNYHRRTELLAQHLDATLHFIQYGHMERVIEAPFRYAVQGLRTWQTLWQERPDVILVQNPPIFCALLVYIYTRRHAAQYVIDSHTGAFVGRKWRWSLWLHRLLSRRALTTLVHNDSQERIVREWGCPHMVLAYTPGDYPAGKPFHFQGQFNIVVISSFRADERPDIVFEAAGQMPEIEFYVTGNPGLLPKKVLSMKPANCHLTGYLPYDRYVSLLSGADAIMALTTRDDTLLMGGFEAVCIGKPFITSDFPVLKDYFYLGTVHVPCTVSGLCHGARVARAERDELQQGMLKLRDVRNAEWQQKLAELRGLVMGGNG